MDRNRRVVTIGDDAETALNKKLLRDKIRAVLKDASTEAPFS